MHLWLVLLVIFNCVVIETALYLHVLGGACQTDADCTGVATSVVCENRKCVCREGYTINEFFQCVREKRHRRQTDFGIRMLGEECESNDECRRTPVDGAKVCLLNQCQCSTGHVPIDAYRCIRDFEQLPSNTRIVKSADREELPGYGSICLTNKDCQQSTAQLECLRGSCVCLEGYVPLGKYLCYNIRGGDAPVTESSTASSSFPTTTPPRFETAEDNKIQSLGKLSMFCTDNYYCRQSVSHSYCYNGKCSCIEGYVSLDLYTCIKDVNQEMATLPATYKSLLGGKCLTNQNCQTPEAICSNNICSCPSESFAIDDWNCFSDKDTLNEKLIQTTTTTSTTTSTASTTGFLWWPWSSSTRTSEPVVSFADIFPLRCSLNRQCITMDSNSHCTSFGRCVCNVGYGLQTKENESRCIRRILEDDNCD